MKFIIKQHRGKPSDAYAEIARVANAVDAILFAAALVNAKPFLGCVQVHRLHKRRSAYCLFCETRPGPHADADVQQALANPLAKEKKWRAEQREEKARAAARGAFFGRFRQADRDTLILDRAFVQCLVGGTIRAQEADARAAELGIYPTVATGEAVAA